MSLFKETFSDYKVQVRFLVIFFERTCLFLIVLIMISNYILICVIISSHLPSTPDSNLRENRNYVYFFLLLFLKSLHESLLHELIIISVSPKGMNKIKEKTQEIG